MRYNWEDWKELLEDLYIKENKNVQDVMEEMENRGIRLGSKAAYERHFRTWKFRKNGTQGEYKSLVHERGKDVDTDIIYRGLRITPRRFRKAVSRYKLSGEARGQEPSSEASEKSSVYPGQTIRNPLSSDLQETKAPSISPQNTCLKCQMLGQLCLTEPYDPNNDSWVCRNCRDAQHDELFGPTLCIRCGLLDIDIFKPCLPSPQLHDSLLAKAEYLNLEGISVSFPVTWTLPAISDGVFQLLKTKNSEMSSKVGTLSSPQFIGLTRGHVSSNMALAFQRMLYATSLSYVHSDDATYTGELSVTELQQLGALSGREFLSSLNKELSPSRLSEANKEKWTVLFLLVFGAILTIGYTSRTHQGSVLCEMLAHHLVFLAARLETGFDSNEQRRVLESAAGRFEVEERYSWAKVVKPAEPNIVGRRFECVFRQREPHESFERPYKSFMSCWQCRTHLQRSHCIQDPRLGYLSQCSPVGDFSLSQAIRSFTPTPDFHFCTHHTFDSIDDSQEGIPQRITAEQQRWGEYHPPRARVVWGAHDPANPFTLTGSLNKADRTPNEFENETECDLVMGLERSVLTTRKLLV